jgi:hypothetical protein
MFPRRVADELDTELLKAIPYGRMVVLTLRAPILKVRQTKDALKNRIVSLVTNSTNQAIDVDEDILGNLIGIKLSSYDGPDPRKVHAAILNRNSDPRITSNARLVLEERIATKTKKCSALALNGPVWLALFNDYFLADADIYRHALAQIAQPHVFQKILLILGDGSVTTLHDRAA